MAAIIASNVIFWLLCVGKAREYRVHDRRCDLVFENTIEFPEEENRAAVWLHLAGRFGFFFSQLNLTFHRQWREKQNKLFKASI